MMLLLLMLLLSITFEKSWILGYVPEDWKRANVTPAYRKVIKGDLGNYRPISLILAPENVMEQILLGTITSEARN